MIRLEQCPQIEPDILAKLERYPVASRPKRWEGKAKAVVQFKSEILIKGLVIQSNKCAWCTLPVGQEGRRTAHRDHIAPKAKYPQWTFLPMNLVIACEYCNGFAVKGEADTVSVVTDIYEDCGFHLVHPYLDEPSNHLCFIFEGDGASVTIRSLSDKGGWTIEKLKLDTPGATMERAKEHLYQQRLSTLPQQQRDLFRNALLAL